MAEFDVDRVRARIRQFRQSLERITREMIELEASLRQAESTGSAANPLRQRFETFWAAYPRKVGKGAAWAVWLKLKPTQELVAQMLEAVRRQSATQQWRKDDGQFIPHLSTWLNQTRWEDSADDLLAFDADAEAAAARTEREARRKKPE